MDVVHERWSDRYGWDGALVTSTGRAGRKRPRSSLLYRIPRALLEYIACFLEVQRKHCTLALLKSMGELAPLGIVSVSLDLRRLRNQSRPMCEAFRQLRLHRLELKLSNHSVAFFAKFINSVEVIRMLTVEYSVGDVFTLEPFLAHKGACCEYNIKLHFLHPMQKQKPFDNVSRSRALSDFLSRQQKLHRLELANAPFCSIGLNKILLNLSEAKRKQSLLPGVVSMPIPKASVLRQLVVRRGCSASEVQQPRVDVDIPEMKCPEAFRNLTNISFQGLRVQSWASALFAVLLNKESRLQIVNLNFCMMPPGTFQQLAESLSNIPTLRIVHAASNFGGVRRLTHREIIGRSIAKLLTSTSLKELYIDKNWISNVEVVCFCDALKQNTSLKVLSMNENAIQEAGAKNLNKVLLYNRTLRRLFLAKNHIPSNVARLLYETAVFGDVIEEIMLDNNNDRNGPRRARVVGTADSGPELAEERLQASGRSKARINGQAGAPGGEMQVAPHKRNSSLKVLWLNGVDFVQTTANCSILSKLSLEKLFIRDSRLGISLLKLLPGILKSTTRLRTLDVERNGLGDRGIGIIVKGLLVNVSVRNFYAGFNNVSAKGALALKELLEHNVTLRVLVLTGNNLGCTGVKRLCNGLAENKTLVTLYLDRNRIHKRGVTILAKVVQAHPALQILCLSQNNIDDDAMCDLERMLKHNGSLRELYLDGNSGKISPLLAQALEVNRTFKRMCLSIKSIDPHVLKGVTVALENNTSFIEIFYRD